MTFIYSPSQLFFKCLNTCTFTYATPTFITEGVCFVTQVQLLLMTVTCSELMAYTELVYSYWVSFHNVLQL